MERTVAGVHPDTNGEGRRDSTGERGETCRRKERVYQRKRGRVHTQPPDPTGHTARFKCGCDVLASRFWGVQTLGQFPHEICLVIAVHSLRSPPEYKLNEWYEFQRKKMATNKSRHAPYSLQGSSMIIQQHESLNLQVSQQFTADLSQNIFKDKKQ